MSDSSALSKFCPKCGAALTSASTEGLCPKCLMAEAMQPTLISDAAIPRRLDVLAPEELAPFFPAYEIMRMLGRGGMGAVYLARQISLNRLVAIKLLPADMNEGEINFAERFKNEAQAMAQLNHPGIVAVYDFGQTTNGLLFIVMEYIEGTDVQLMLVGQGRLHSAHAMAITAHVCDALQYAHTRGIIHRDIKPSNIMVSNDGVVKVADFGLAKMSHGQTTGLTQSGMAMGTLHFMAPESLTLGSAVDQRADIYAVGVMLYQMLTGKLPQGMFEMPSFQVAGLDPRYDRIVARALRDDRELRYQAALELRYDLDAILTQPVEKAVPEAEEEVRALPSVEERAKKARPQRWPYMAMEADDGKSRKPKRTGHFVYGWIAVMVTLAVAGMGVWFALFLKSSRFTDAPDREGWQNLMRLIEPARDAVNGRWTKQDGELVCKPSEWALCEVPLNYSGGNYDYRISLTRGEGLHLAVFFPFRKGDAAGDVIFDIMLSGFKTGRRAGLENVAGVPLSSTEEQVRSAGGVVCARPEWIPRGVKCTVLIQVRDEGVCVSLNGQEVWRWKGDWAYVKQSLGFEQGMFSKLNGRKVFAVGLYGCEAIFHSIEMREVSGQEGRLLPTEAQVDEVSATRVVDVSSITGSTKEEPFVNTLGMKFVPVPITRGPTNGKRVLFSMWETRVQDYESFVKDANRAWPTMPFAQGPTHPAANVTREDAKAFCIWLTDHEHKAGRLGPDERYRLPSDHEWSCAVGIGDREDAALAPEQKHQKLVGVYPWGSEWPPPARAGNYGSEELKPAVDTSKYPGVRGFIGGLYDGFAETAPVGSFAANPFGLFDLGGNVWEWCEDSQLSRGGSWNNANREYLYSSFRSRGVPLAGQGFRLVLVSSSN